MKCDFLPDDQSQLVAVDEFASGITDLSIDFARLTPLPVETRLLGRAECNNCGNSSETYASWATAKGATTGQPISVTVPSDPPR